MNSDEFRKWGKTMVDFMADYWDSLRDRQPLPDVKPGDVRKMLPTEAPQYPESWESIFKDLEPIVLKGVNALAAVQQPERHQCEALSTGK